MPGDPRSARPRRLHGDGISERLIDNAIMGSCNRSKPAADDASVATVLQPKWLQPAGSGRTPWTCRSANVQIRGLNHPRVVWLDGTGHNS